MQNEEMLGLSKIRKEEDWKRQNKPFVLCTWCLCTLRAPHRALKGGDHPKHSHFLFVQGTMH